MSDGPKILTFDIETSPHLGWFFGTRNINIRPDQIKEPTRMICWSAKWHHEKSVIFCSEYHHTRSEMLFGLWSLLNQADVVVTYNGDNFDIPHVNREFHLEGLGQYQPSISVDLYKVIRKNEKWASHKLAYITEQLNLSGKLETEFGLWLACMGELGPDEQRKAWTKMRRYAKRDTFTTEEVFDEYRPVITNIPHVGLWRPEGEPDFGRTCRDCESPNLIRQGWRRTKTRRYRQYKCGDCGRWQSDNRSEGGVSNG